MSDSQTEFIDKDLLRHLVEIRFSMTICMDVVSKMMVSLWPLSRYKLPAAVCTYATACKTSLDFTNVYGLILGLFDCCCNHSA